MNRYSFSIWADGRPMTHLLENQSVVASDFPPAFSRAYRQAKKVLRRGTKEVTIKVTRI